MSLKSRRRALLILGMHRSGTSCVTRIANLTGITIGNDLLPPQPDNPAGFWEHAALSSVNEKILAQLDTTWDSLGPLPEHWSERADLLPIKQELRDILGQNFADDSDFVIKDPRLCLLVPIWREVLTELGCEVEFIIVVRDARAVVSSLARRSGYPSWHSELLWLRYNLMAELQTRGCRRALLHYEEIIDDWRAAFGKVTGSIAFRLPDLGDKRSRAIDDFVSPQLNHFTDDTLDLMPPASPWSRSVMNALAGDGALDDATSLKELDRVRQELLAADPLLAPQDQHWRSEYLRISEESNSVEKIDARLAILDQAWQRRTDQIEDHAHLNRRSVERLTERLESLEAESQQRNQERLDSLTAERSELNERVAAQSIVQQDLEEALEAASTKNHDFLAQNQSLLMENDKLRAKCTDSLEAFERARADSTQQISQLREELSRSETELANTHHELTSHSQVLTNMVASRSWKLTSPLRRLTALSRGDGHDALEANLRNPVPWHELLPGRPFQQRFKSPHPELTGLGIGFFSYGRDNQTSVRVRLFEERGIGRSKRLLHDYILRGNEIKDGKTSSTVFEQEIQDADNKSFFIEIESIDGKPGKTVTVALGQSSYHGQILSRDKRGENKTHGLLVLEMRGKVIPTRKAFAFVSGCPGGAYRYRCEHQAEMLQLRGYSVDIFPADEFPWKEILGSYQVVVAHRVPHTTEFENFASEARSQGMHVVFDTDDLIFAPEVENQIAALDDLTQSERALWLDGIHRYHKSLTLVDRAMVSTTALKHSLESRLDKAVHISRNRVSEEMVIQASRAQLNHRNSDSAIRIGYLSGTPTHKRDFADCVPALAIMMMRHPLLRLSLVGHIDIPIELKAFSDRIDFLPLVAWQELPEIYADIDINLAPLERDNEFTKGKSELKYVEAALMGIPTAASRLGSYSEAIRDGENGFLCASTDEWVSALEQLVSDPILRERVAEAARLDVMQNYTSRGAASRTVDTWLELLGPRDGDGHSLRIAMIVRAPIASTGGGYKKIFHLVEYLSLQGHDVTVYVEPVAHLHEKPQSYIESYCKEHFDCGDAKIVAGHQAIADCDVAVATNWPTASVVNELPNARLRFYFVQDDEAEFYDEGDPLRAAAAATYDLPLLIVGIGRYLPSLIGERNRMPYPNIDFALSEVFFEERAATLEKLEAMEASADSRLLFFARPGIPRRAFDMGVEALTAFQTTHPEVEIRLYGLDKPMDLPFEYVDLGVIDQSELAAEMRSATAHMSFSRTNGSTVMFEAMACGAVAIELDAEGVRALLDNPTTCVLCPDSAKSVNQCLVELFSDRKRLGEIARAGFESTSSLTIENMCSQFESILLHHSLAGRNPR